MSFEDLGQYALGAECRADLYSDLEDSNLLRTECIKLRSRCYQILFHGGQVESDEIPAWVRAIAFPLKRGKDRKKLFQTKTINAPLHGGGYYLAEVTVSTGYQWVDSDTSPKIGGEESLYINFEPVDNGIGEEMSSLHFSLARDEGSMETDSIDGLMDLGDYAMVNALLDEFEKR